MLNILIPSFFLLLLPIFFSNAWALTIISLMFISFLSINFLYQPIISFSLLNPLFMYDQMSSCLISLTLWISALMILTSNQVSIMNKNPIKFMMFVILLCFALILSFSVSNFISFYIAFESSLIPTLLLVLGWGYQPERLQAGLYLMLYTICASLPLLMSLILVSSSLGSLFFFSSFYSNSLFVFDLSSLWWSITILAFMVKMPIYIFHLWLPKAHVEAPIAGSMILAGLLLKLGGYGLLRAATLFPSSMFKISPLFNSIALWGALITSFICLRQTDIKSLIAYSSVGHMALVIVGCSLTSTWGWQGALVMMIAHGLCSSCLFALANLTYESTKTRSLFLTKGILALFPAISLWWFMLSICNMAAPPSINLFGEIALISSAIWASSWFMIPLGFCSFLAAAYSLYLFTSTNHGHPSRFSNPQSILSQHNYSLSLLHAAPIFLLILSPNSISIWT
uniref:NADH-ubiquinone oxidoreductase chain 4 n=1 Tax=Drieschia cf. elegans BG-2021 TaxID=2839741 RepID=A0A8E7MLP1_9ANNE|nr:NADH dehydrogenase subunit 4 [Drieschia cf. elegans BG-2021]